MRADAERNRRKILDAAREEFASHGRAATTDEIADRAGVGKGTLYRRFANKQALLEAVLNDLTSQFEALVPSQGAETAPELSLREFVVDAARFYLQHAGFFETVITGAGERALPAELRERLLAACDQPLRRAQEAEAVRRGLSSLDVLRLIKMLAVAGDMGDVSVAEEDLDRYADLVFEGLLRNEPLR